MKRLILPIIADMALAASCEPRQSAIASIQQGFEDIRIVCYRYWISNNISADGVVKYLQAMKSALK